MSFVEDFDSFFDTEDFAVDATFGSTTINGIFDESFMEVQGVEGFTRCLLAPRPMFQVSRMVTH